MIRGLPAAAIVVLAGVLASCAGPPPAPVEDRSARAGSYEITPDGHYRVRRGDTLHAIAFKFGLDWREIARLNKISAPYLIYPDQILRLTASSPSEAAAARPKKGAEQRAGPSSAVQTSAAPSPASTTTRTAESPGAGSGQAGQAGADLPDHGSGAVRQDRPPAATSNAAAGNRTQAPAGTRYSTPAGDPARWLWPTKGRILSGFRANDPARKGIDIGGQAGQPVIASAAGQVVYSGSGLIGYGELIIIKHSDRMLSAYAHNSKRMVSEGQQVTAGSEIAEMGTNDRNRALLHFEIRVNGTPEDPLKYLPQR